MSDKLPFHRRITVRLIALFGSLVLAGALAGAYSSIRLAKTEFFNIMGRQFNSTFVFAENSLDILGQMARTWSFSFTQTRDLSSQVRAENGQISRYVEQLRQRARCDAIIVLDERGRIIHHSAFDEKNGESLMAWQIVRQAVNEKISSYAIIEESGNFIVYGSAIAAPDAGSGRSYIVLTGFKISDELVAKLSEGSAIGLTFVRRTAVMASSFSTPQKKLIDSPVPFLDYQLLYERPESSALVRIGERSYYASVRRLRLLDPAMDGSLMLTYPSDELAVIVARLQEKYLWLYAIGMVIFTLAIWRISYRIMAPLRALAGRVRRVARGDFMPTTIDRRDEIGSIASSFNELLNELTLNKRKIEQHAEELERLVEQRTHELSLANEELTRQATHDALTGLPNRKLFNDRLQQAVMLAHRSDSAMALMFIDLDRFKWANDTFGHAAGDELLVHAAKRIQSCLREGDTVARLGGDEFTVVLSHSGTLAAIENVAERILKELTTPFALPAAGAIEISGSIGIAVYPQNGDAAAQLLRHADQAMYAAKKSGRATYRFWQPDMAEHHPS